MNDDTLRLICLSLIPSIGGATIRLLLQHHPNTETLFKLKKKDFAQIPMIGLKTSELLITAKKNIPKAEEIIERALKEEVNIITLLDSKYPNRLKHIHDCPAVLYSKGNTKLNHKIHVAIVGTRKATSYGKKNTEAIIEALAPHKPVIISGLAYGIDAQAHRSALKHGLDTIAVMASGVDIIYPKGHLHLAKDICQQGCLLSENSFGEEADSRRFPARNRIIAGLSDTTIVIEAAVRGGALITAHLANDYNRDVFAIPGNLGEKYSEGCNNLIKTNKANLLTSIKDIEYIMNWNRASLEKQKTLEIPFESLKLKPLEKEIIKIIKEHVDNKIHIDSLCWQTQVPVSKITSCLLNLELHDLIKMMPGRMIKLDNKYS